MQSRLVLLCLASACSFREGLAPPAIDAADLDVPIDTAAVDSATIDGMTWKGCQGRWHDNTLAFKPTTAISAINQGGIERDPWLRADELVIWWSSDRNATTANPLDVFRATRSSVTGTFGAAVLEGIASANDGAETKMSRTSDDLYMVVGSTRLNLDGNVDIWGASRASTSANFSAPARTQFVNVNSADSDHDPTINADGLHVYYAKVQTGAQHIAIATRPTRADNFGVGTVIPELDSNMGDADPSVTTDELIIVFASSRTGTGVPMGANIWYASRSGTSQPFSAPRLVPNVNTDSGDGDPHLSDDGCRLYFASNRAGANNWDIYVAEVQ